MSNFIVKKSRKKKHQHREPKSVNSYDIKQQEQILRICRNLSPDLNNIKYADIAQMCKLFDLKDNTFYEDDILTKKLDDWLQNKRKANILAQQQHMKIYGYNEKLYKKQNEANYLMKSIQQIHNVGACGLRRLSKLLCFGKVIFQYQLFDKNMFDKYKVYEMQYTRDRPDIAFNTHCYQFHLFRRKNNTDNILAFDMHRWYPGIYWFRIRPVVRFEPSPQFGTFSSTICIIHNWIGYLALHWLQQDRDLESHIPVEIYQLMIKCVGDSNPFDKMVYKQILHQQMLKQKQSQSNYIVNWKQMKQNQRSKRHRSKKKNTPTQTSWQNVFFFVDWSIANAPWFFM